MGFHRSISVKPHAKTRRGKSSSAPLLCSRSTRCGEALMTRLLRSSIAIGSLVLCGGISSAGQPAYRVQLLSTPENCDAYSQFHGLGENGEAAGILVCDDGPASQAVSWDEFGVAELATLGGPSAAPFGVARKGVVLGWAETP